MFTQFSLPIVHPAFEQLKKNSRILHFIAGAIIAVNAVHDIRVHDGSWLINGSALLLALDIILLAFLVQHTLRVSILFRFLEGLLLTCIAFNLIYDAHFTLGIISLISGIAYFFLFFRERRIYISESVEITHTGISVPNFLKHQEIGWDQIRRIAPDYRRIVIETIRNKKFEFDLSRNLKMDELVSIDDFCSMHLVGSIK